MRHLLAVVILLAALGGCEGQEAKRPSPRKPAVQVIAFTASWCGPCQRAKPILARIQAGGVDVRIVDIDAQPDLARQNGVVSVPTFLVRTRNGVERTQDIAVVLRLVGGKP